jgi:hypothetical protein
MAKRYTPPAKAEPMKTEAQTAVMGDGADEKDEVKKVAPAAKITRKDWQKIESHLKAELEDRKNSDFRRRAEAKWLEIDRQIAMTPMVKVNRDGTEVDQGWHNVVELGELSKASENLSADVRRIVFPPSRFWFEPHADIDEALPLDRKSGQKERDPKLQDAVNGRLRSLMTQQHADFGLKDRVELSIKEALHHGGFVAEVDLDTQEMVYEAVKVKSKSAPIWKPHSMWNCYPDQSPSVIGTNLFYDGSMFVESYMPRHKAERMVKKGKDDGWMPSQWRKVSKDEHQGKDGEKLKDVKLTTYWGDIYIERDEESLYFPNHKAILANGTIVYMAPNKTPYPPIIYRGYERSDVRDPYYTSPIIKMSPMQKLGSMLANKAMDGIELALEPPIVYDGNDPDFVLNGGPVIEPGAKVSTKGSNAFSQIKIGDPGIAIQGLQLVLNEMKEKLGRPGKPVGDRATKAEVVKNAQDAEVSMIDFIDKMELALKSFLFMQHAMNLDCLTEYSFYSPEMMDPDFIRITNKELPRAVHFEVVGARGVLGEQERAEKFTQAFAFALGNPLTAQLLDVSAGLTQIFQDAGTKHPEAFLIEEGKDNAGALKAENAQLKQAIQKLGGLLDKEKSHSQVKMSKIQSDGQAKAAKTQADAIAAQQRTQADAMAKHEKTVADYQAKMNALQAQRETDFRELRLEFMRFMAEHSHERKVHSDTMALERDKAKNEPKAETAQ